MLSTIILILYVYFIKLNISNFTLGSLIYSRYRSWNVWVEVIKPLNQNHINLGSTIPVTNQSAWAGAWHGMTLERKLHIPSQYPMLPIMECVSWSFLNPWARIGPMYAALSISFSSFISFKTAKPMLPPTGSHLYCNTYREP